MLRVFLFLGLSLLVSNGQDKPDHKERGKLILKEIIAQPWAVSWKDAKLGEIHLIKQKADLAQPTGLPPVWHAKIEGPEERTGYLMWDQAGEGRLVEFALDDPKQAENAITGIPAIQQFPLPEAEGGPIASGCVPTSAASLLSYWMTRKEQAKPDSNELTLTLRKRLRMIRFPDTDGFTEDGMALAGALPSSMARAFAAEAQKQKLAITVRHLPFSMNKFRKEIAAKRPVLLSCTVRVPHKPHLSWGHAVVGLGASKVDGVDLVGIHDNFFPTKNAGTIRWIRSDAFRSLTEVRPMEK